MRKYYSAALQFSLLFCFSIHTSVFADAEAKNGHLPKEAPHSFSDIRLSPEGVLALDSLGNRWYYDFDSGQFLLDDRSESIAETPESELPIEERAVEEKIVEPLEQSVVVAADEYVEGDIIAYGRITIRGWVKGNVQSATSRVLVMETGQVDGDITAPEILVRPGGVVMGRVKETGSIDTDYETVKQVFDFDGIIVVIAFTLSLMLACFVITTLMPRQVNVLDRCIRTYRLRSFSLGFLSLFLIPIGILLLIITILGILAIPLVPLIIIFIFFATFAGFSKTLGEKVLARLLPSRKTGNHLATQLGIIMFMSLWLITAILLGSGDSVSEGFGIFFLVISILTNSYILLSGLGAAILTRVGTREYLGWHERHIRATESQAPMPAPPPIPDMPPAQPPSHDIDRSGGNSPV